jgi:Transposase DDE domain
LLKGDYYLPLLWVPLPKDGSSSQDERIALLERFCQFWPAPERCVLLADREFAGRIWIRWLGERGMSMVIRLREDIYLDEVMVSLRQAYPHAKIRRAVKRRGYFMAPITLAGQALYYIALPDQEQSGEVVCLLSDSPDVAWVYQAYGRRWKIEVFFKQIKTDGFNLEDIRVVDIDRVRVLMAVASFAYVLALHQGLVEAEKQPVKLKKDAKNGKSWPAVSLFRLGYRWLRERAGQADRFVRFVLRLVRKLAQAIRSPTAPERQFAKSVQ